MAVAPGRPGVGSVRTPVKFGGPPLGGRLKSTVILFASTCAQNQQVTRWPRAYVRAKFDLCTGVDEAGEDIFLGLSPTTAAHDLHQSVLPDERIRQRNVADACADQASRRCRDDGVSKVASEESTKSMGRRDVPPGWLMGSVYLPTKASSAHASGGGSPALLR